MKYSAHAEKFHFLSAESVTVSWANSLIEANPSTSSKYFLNMTTLLIRLLLKPIQFLLRSFQNSLTIYWNLHTSPMTIHIKTSAQLRSCLRYVMPVAYHE